MKMERVAIAMSGGVDSSVAAAILKEAGYDLVGFSMQLWDQKRNALEGDASKSGRCCSIEDLYDAREVAARLEIPYYVVDFQKEFESTIVKTFIENYRMGLTPSPCVLCNSHMKFDLLARMAEEIQAPRIATGHYARVSHDPESGRFLLWQARDKNKDQSYFLFELNQIQLSKALFPLGELEKEQVRQIARRHKLSVAEKAESQEICFIPDGDYAAFVERHHAAVTGVTDSNPFAEGEIIDRQGRCLGTHPGIHHYTIGQRRGLGIAHSSPLYVLDIRPKDNVVVVGERSQLDRCRCRVIRPNWISIPCLSAPLRVEAKIRSRHAAAPAIISPMEENAVDVVFDSPQSAITPGQACVFYQEEKVVGGGWIDRFSSERSQWHPSES
jgi:tRNA-uridine 2-sulfurtransferase